MSILRHFKKITVVFFLAPFQGNHRCLFCVSCHHLCNRNWHYKNVTSLSGWSFETHEEAVVIIQVFYRMLEDHNHVIFHFELLYERPKHFILWVSIIWRHSFILNWKWIVYCVCICLEKYSAFDIPQGTRTLQPGQSRRFVFEFALMLLRHIAKSHQQALNWHVTWMSDTFFRREYDQNKYPKES